MRGLQIASFNVIVGLQIEGTTPRNCRVASNELQVTPIIQVNTRDTTAVIIEYKCLGKERKVNVTSLYLMFNNAQLSPTVDLVQLVHYSQ